MKDENLAKIIISTFLQGSYRRSTAIRPHAEGNLMDVDVVVVTSIDRHKTKPREALDMFKPFLDKHYKNKYKLQGRSWGISLSYVELDLVPASAPSESLKNILKSQSVTTDKSILEAVDWRLSPSWSYGGKVGQASESKGDDSWRKEPLWIPNREVATWDKTHPLAQIEATVEKNRLCDGHYVNVVKCIKWWRSTQQPLPKYPKSYPLEHIIWCTCPAGTESVAQGVVLALEGTRDKYKYDALIKKVPFIPDHGVPEHNVLGRVSGDDFSKFHGHVCDAAELARQAYDEKDTSKSAALWQKLFGNKFPPASGKSSDGEPPKGGYTPRMASTTLVPNRFA